MDPADSQFTDFVENVLRHAASNQVPVSDRAGTTGTTHLRDEEGEPRQNITVQLLSVSK